MLDTSFVLSWRVQKGWNIIHVVFLCLLCERLVCKCTKSGDLHICARIDTHVNVDVNMRAAISNDILSISALRDRVDKG